ncbi:YlmF protein [Streptococcus pneumoniae]|nr:YlmF protein [Streptococcus pneumoniae]
MSLKDRFDRFIDYFTEDEDSSLPYEKRDEPVFTSVNSSQEPALPMNQPSQSAGTKENNITRLHARQQELANQSQRATDKVIIDVRYPRKYEDEQKLLIYWQETKVS